MGVKSGAPKANSRPGIYVGQALALLVMALLAYLPSFRVPFQYDDVGLIEHNQYIRISSLSPANLARAGIQDYKQNRPVSNLSFALNYYFGGLDPFGYHLVNFVILILTAAGIWLLMRKLLLRLGFDPFRSGLAGWMTALIWAAHPVNTQAVTYIIQRHTSLSGAFCIWSLFFFHLGAEQGRATRFFYALSGISCALALLCKETALTLPLIILAYKLYFFDEFKPGWLRRNWKWIMGLMLFYLAASAFALRPSMLERLSYYFGMMQFSAGQRLLTEFRVLVWYPLLVIFPLPCNLSLVHEFGVSTSLLHPVTTLIDMILVSGLVFAALVWARQRKLFSFAVVWYFGLLLVEALPLPIELAHEHRLYLASLGIIAPLACAPVLKIEKFGRAFILLVLIAIFFAGFTRERNSVWQSGEGLWKDTIEKAPYSSVAWYNYCTALPVETKCDRVINACSRALESYENDYRVYNNVGYCHLQSGRLDDAEKYLAAASRVVSKKSINAENLSIQDRQEMGAIDFNLGNIYMIKKEYEKAAKSYEAAIKNNPVDHEARRNLALALSKSGKCEQALELIEKAPAPSEEFKKVIEDCNRQKPRPPGQE